MRCSHADTALKVVATRTGDILCQPCYDQFGNPKDKPVRTNKKVWAGSQADGADKNKEKIQAFGEKIAAKAKQHRHRFSEPQHPVLRERMGFST